MRYLPAMTAIFRTPVPPGRRLSVHNSLMTSITRAGLLACLCTLPACETMTSEGYRQVMDLKVGMTTDQVTAERGQPSRIAPLNGDRELWIYSTSHRESGGGGTVMFTTRRSQDSWTRASDGKDKSTSDSDTTALPLDSYLYDVTCETRFLIGPDKRVQKVTFEGNGCKAEETKPKQVMP